MGGEKVKIMKLTRRQKEILDFITEFIGRKGYSPSMEEKAERFAIASLNAVYKHLEALQTRGYLTRDANRARSIELAAGNRPLAKELPLYGYIAAGHPIDAVRGAETLAIPEDLLGGKGEHYVLRVRGDSMIDEHIADGDYVIVESRREAGNGEMVVALVDDESATMKRLYREGEEIRLQPANSALAPMRYAAERVRVQGVIVGVMRKYR